MFTTDIRQQEREIISGIDQQLVALDAQIATTRRAQALRHSPGWTDFVAELEKAIQRATSELVTSNGSAHHLRQLQGRIQALRDVVAMMARGDAVLEELAKRRREVEDRKAELLRLMPRQRPVEQTT